MDLGWLGLSYWIGKLVKPRVSQSSSEVAFKSPQVLNGYYYYEMAITCTHGHDGSSVLWRKYLGKTGVDSCPPRSGADSCIPLHHITDDPWVHVIDISCACAFNSYPRIVNSQITSWLNFNLWSIIITKVFILVFLYHIVEINFFLLKTMFKATEFCFKNLSE